MHYTQNKHRKTYTPEFKLQCVQAYLSGKSPTAICNEYSLHIDMLRNWVKKYLSSGESRLQDARGKHGNHNSPGRPKKNFESELEQLRYENMKLKGELFILKKFEELKKKRKD